jgi:hypothetical protein
VECKLNSADKIRIGKHFGWLLYPLEPAGIAPRRHGAAVFRYDPKKQIANDVRFEMRCVAPSTSGLTEAPP